MDVKVSSKRDGERSVKSASSEEKRHAKQIEDDHKKKLNELQDQLTEALSNILLGEKIPLDVVNSETAKSSFRRTAKSRRRVAQTRNGL